MFLVQDIQGSSYTFPALFIELTIFLRMPNYFYLKIEFRIQCVRHIYSHYLPDPLIRQSLESVHMHVSACVCVSSLYTSGSDITKCWIICKTC